MADLAAPSSRVRQRATRALMKAGGPAVRPVAGAAASAHPETRNRALRVMRGLLADSSVPDSLFEDLTESPAPQLARLVRTELPARPAGRLLREVRRDVAAQRYEPAVAKLEFAASMPLSVEVRRECHELVNLVARVLVRQARELFRAGQLDQASAKARTAGRLPAAYSVFDDRPDCVLADIDLVKAARIERVEVLRRGQRTTRIGPKDVVPVNAVETSQPWWEKFTHSKKAREIERNLGYDN
ncbi:MAG TPA: hypothetical protein VML55_21755 [Planctomycetaceae bacterium]|nr:hypothetical protein [Planctomycetaceae bacterium]